MSKTLLSFFICYFISGLPEPSTGQNLTVLQKTIIGEQVDSAFHRSIKAAGKLEFDQLSLGVSDKYHAGFIVNDTYYSQYDSLISVVKSRSQSVAKQTFAVRKEKITVLSEHVVLLTACGASEVELNNGNIFTLKFYWSFVYEKAGSDWKVIQSHQSSVR